MRSSLIFLTILVAAGCAGIHEKRVDKIDAELVLLQAQLEAAQVAGDGPKEVEIREKITAFEGERRKESELAEKEIDGRRLLLLTILGVVTGGLKLAADYGKKVIG